MLDSTKKVIAILSRREKLMGLGLVGIMFITSLLEGVGISALFPYMKMISEPAWIEKNHMISSIYHGLGFENHMNFFIACGVAICGVVLFKTLFSLVNIRYITTYIEGMVKRLSAEFIQNFLSRPYEVTLTQNKTALAKDLLVEVVNATSVVKNVLLAILASLSSLVVLSILVAVDPKLMLSVIALVTLMTTLSYFLVKKKITRSGEQITQANQMLYKTSLETLQGAKDIKSYQAERFFYQQFLTHIKVRMCARITADFFATIPGNLMNFISFAGLVGVLLYFLITRDGDIVSVIPILALIGLSVQRLLPNIINFYSAISNAQKLWPSIHIVESWIRVKKNQEPVFNPLLPLTLKQNLCLEHVTFSYAKSTIPVLKGVNLRINKNESLGIVGISGAGKSTLVDVMMGLLQATAGQIYCDKVKVSSNEYYRLRSLFAYVPQDTCLIDASLSENIALGIDKLDIDPVKLSEAVAVAQLGDVVAQLTEGLSTLIGERGVQLSGGQRQRVGIARALYRDAPIIVMDEATNALDTATEKVFTQAVQTLKSNKTLIIIAHRLSSVRDCDRIIVLESGKIVGDGPYDQLVKHCPTFQSLYHESSEGVW